MLSSTVTRYGKGKGGTAKGGGPTDPEFEIVVIVRIVETCSHDSNKDLKFLVYNNITSC